MDIKTFLNILQQTPVILKGNEVPIIYLDDNTKIMRNLELFNEMIDNPEPIEEKPVVILDKINKNPWKFPVIEISEDVFNENLNFLICEKYNSIEKKIFSQKEIAKYITSNIDYDVIITIIVDGLSYLDASYIDGVRACFVNGPTLTKIGMRNIINDPPIALRLFDLGFKKRIGFSYWNRDEILTNIIFHSFTQSQMKKVREFKEILSKLESMTLENSYVQIVVEGCDQVCHRNRDRPLVKEIVNRLFNNWIVNLSRIIIKKNISAIIYLMADHGIWWNQNTSDKKNYKIISHPQATSKRYISGNVIGEHFITISCYGNNYSVLKYPYIFNDYAINEWGTHGGISIYESFVPFYVKKVVV